jgi:hypothetical protein
MRRTAVTVLHSNSLQLSRGVQDAGGTVTQ